MQMGCCQPGRVAAQALRCSACHIAGVAREYQADRVVHVEPGLDVQRAGWVAAHHECTFVGCLLALIPSKQSRHPSDNRCVQVRFTMAGGGGRGGLPDCIVHVEFFVCADGRTHVCPNRDASAACGVD
jgi:hypothetical protein